MSGAAAFTAAARAFEYGRPMAEANVITVEDAAAPGATTTTQHEGAGEGGLPQFQIHITIAGYPFEFLRIEDIPGC